MLGETLGSGAFGTVYRGACTAACSAFAVWSFLQHGWHAGTLRGEEVAVKVRLLQANNVSMSSLAVTAGSSAEPGEPRRCYMQRTWGRARLRTRPLSRRLLCSAGVLLPALLMQLAPAMHAWLKRTSSNLRQSDSDVHSWCTAWPMSTSYA